MARALVIIDIQNDYFPGGRSELVGADAAAARAAEVLASFRERGEQVVHVQHVWDAADAEFFAPGTPGVEINRAVAPVGRRAPSSRRRSPTASCRPTSSGGCATPARTSSCCAG